jgi:hypothetical protein
MTAGNHVGDDVGNDVGNGNNGGNDAGDNAKEGDGGDTGGEGGGGSWRRTWRRRRQQRQRRRQQLHIAGVIAFYCEDIFVWYFYDVGGIGEVTPPLTHSSGLRYVGVLLGGDGNCPQKLWYVNTKN